MPDEKTNNDIAAERLRTIFRLEVRSFLRELDEVLQQPYLPGCSRLVSLLERSRDGLKYFAQREGIIPSE